jgi:hypothetical protein
LRKSGDVHRRGLVGGTQEVFVALFVDLQIVSGLFAGNVVAEKYAVRGMLKPEVFHRWMLSL